MSLQRFIKISRAEMEFEGKTAVRQVYRSELLRALDDGSLEGLMAQRIPTYYRAPESIARDLREGYFFNAIADTLSRLPTKEDFRNSHFGELLAAEFAATAMGLKLLYSKLRLLTAENANAYKMDVVMYDPGVDPIELVLLEVKSSFKTVDGEGKPASHDKSIYADLFTSFNKYEKEDLRYDLTAARDRLDEVDEHDRGRLREALTRYPGPSVRYAGVCSIDLATFSHDEAALLATRKNPKSFDVDLLCVVEFAQVIDATFGKLENLWSAARDS